MLNHRILDFGSDIMLNLHLKSLGLVWVRIFLVLYSTIFYYILLFFTIFKIVNTEKIYFLKLCLDCLENLKQS